MRRSDRNERTLPEKLSDYLDGVLSLEERQELEEALEQDPELRAMLDAFRRLRGLAEDAVPDDPVPFEEYYAPIGERIAEIEPEKEPPPAEPEVPVVAAEPVGRRPWWVIPGFAALILLTVGLVWWRLQNPEVPERVVAAAPEATTSETTPFRSQPSARFESAPTPEATPPTAVEAEPEPEVVPEAAPAEPIPERPEAEPATSDEGSVASEEVSAEPVVELPSPPLPAPETVQPTVTTVTTQGSETERVAPPTEPASTAKAPSSVSEAAPPEAVSSMSALPSEMPERNREEVSAETESTKGAAAPIELTSPVAKEEPAAAPVMPTFALLGSGAEAMSRAATSPLLPYRMRLVRGDTVLHETDVHLPMELAFQYGERYYRIELTRGADGRWTLTSEYRLDPGAAEAEEARERYFDPNEGIEGGVPEETVLRRVRLAQPYSQEPRLFVEIVSAGPTRVRQEGDRP